MNNKTTTTNTNPTPSLQGRAGEGLPSGAGEGLEGRLGLDLGLLLTPHFTLQEMVRSGMALRHGIDNTPRPEHVAALRRLCEDVLEPLRRRFGRIIVTSGYRSPELNRLVGGVPTSQHLRGEAADLHVSSQAAGQRMADYIRQNLPHRQVLLEHRHGTSVWWVHVGR